MPPPVAVNEMLVKVQVSWVAEVLLVMDAAGALVFCVRTTFAIALHPLDPVAVTV